MPDGFSRVLGVFDWVHLEEERSLLADDLSKEIFRIGEEFLNQNSPPMYARITNLVVASRLHLRRDNEKQSLQEVGTELGTENTQAVRTFSNEITHRIAMVIKAGNEERGKQAMALAQLSY